MIELFKQNRMFRMLLTYQFFSSIGGGMFSMFILLSVHLIYQNPIYTGIAGFLMAAPFIFSFAIGPIVDRRNKVSIMCLTTLLEFLVISLLAFTPVQEQFGILFMFAVILIYNIAALFESPAGNALLPQVVGAEKILEANSMIRIAAMMGGIFIAAVLFISLRNEPSFDFIYGFSAAFLAIAFITSLFLKNATPKGSIGNISSTKYVQDLKEGAKFVRSNVLLYVMITATAMGMFAEITFVNRPMFLEYHVGAQGYIIFSTVVLLGGIFASSFMGKIGNRFRMGQLILMLFLLAGVSRIIFVFVLPIRVMSGIVAMITYATFGSAINIIFSSLNQKIPSADMVGRVVTLSSTFRSVFATIGALIGGIIGSIIPVVDHIFIYQGLSYIIIAMLMWIVPSVRTLPRMSEIKRG